MNHNVKVLTVKKHSVELIILRFTLKDIWDKKTKNVQNAEKALSASLILFDTNSTFTLLTAGKIFSPHF